jgi:hypothetical protein
VRFKTTLDPALLLASQEAGCSVPKGKGKARAAMDDNSNRKRARKPLARVNSLILSTDSPKYIKEQLQQAGSGSKHPSTTLSTIGSFGSRSSIGLSIDAPATGWKPRPTPVEAARSNTDGHTATSAQRRGIDASIAELDNDAMTLPNQPTPIVPSMGDETADEAWNNIWGRWNSQKYSPHSKLLPANKHNLTNLQEVLEEAEKHLTSSQQSHLSIHSENGHFEASWSIREELPEVPEEGGSHLPQAETSMALTETLDDSRSRIDEGLLLDDESNADEDEEENEQVQHRLRMLCDESAKEMRTVRHFVFKGKSVGGELTSRLSKRLLLTPFYMLQTISHLPGTDTICRSPHRVD